MDKNLDMSTKSSEKPFDGYYTIIAKACGCSSKYVQMVLTKNLGKYKERETELVMRIRQKAAEINKAIYSEGDFSR